MKNKGRLFVVSGPSGVGKTTLLKRLLEEQKESLSFSVSYTSRQPREGEIDGKDYHFVSQDEFMKGIENNIFLEHAIVHGNYYGTTQKCINDILQEGKNCLLDIDVQGGTALIDKDIEAVYVFIAPPNIETLRKRLLNRSTDAIEVINKRVANAEKELLSKEKYDYIVINDDIEQAYKQLKSIFGNQEE